MNPRHRNVRNPARPPWLLLLLAVAAVGAAVFVLTRSPETPQQPSSSPAANDQTPPKTGPTTAEGRTPAPPPQLLVGRWQRTDGNYALDIRRVHSDGRADAGYSNPGPINVARAEVKQDGNRLLLFVELRDVNYPGATYMLAYHPAQDALVGSYHQPALGDTFEVAFTRAKQATQP